MTSKIKVDNIENQCGGAVVTKCGATTTISGSVVKANDVQASDGGNLVSQSGTTITLGASGDTINLASGASQSGFGRTGTVDWQTASIKTSTFTAANGEGYFANTSGGAFTVNLPAGSAGAIVSLSDYTRTFQTNSLTVSPNGSEKIGGVAADAILSTEGQTATFIYVDGTEGWINTQETSNSVTGNPFLVATGGTITTCGNDKIHTFTGPGTFTVSQVHPCAANNLVSYMVVAGGGSGGPKYASGAANATGGGGGAGGYREVKSPVTPYTASPLDGYPSSPNRITVTATAFPITVGGGGTETPISPPGSPGNDGSNSVFSTITSAGGGGGGEDFAGGRSGGSGGGSGGEGGPGAGGSGNAPPVTPPQGQNGGSGGAGGPRYGSGAGGGAGGAGGGGSTGGSGNGGVGTTSSITGSPVARAGGGGGGGYCGAGGDAGPGGGGAGNGNPACGAAGTVNTGGGGGGGGSGSPSSRGAGEAGGSGIVVIRYKFQ